MMKAQYGLKKGAFYSFMFILFVGYTTIAQNDIENKKETPENYEQNAEFKGIVRDITNNKSLAYVDIHVSETNIGTITNAEGEFLLKVPSSHLNKSVVISILGYKKKEVLLSEFKKGITKIDLEVSVIELSDINIYSPKDVISIVKAMLNNKGKYNFDDQTIMTAFYRETIKKRRKNASLSEAVVQIHKQPKKSLRRDAIELIKSRKNTNYSRLDTIALKLQGGPFSNLHTDIIKYPEYIFSDEDLEYYDFSFDQSTQINKNLVYVISFKQKENVITPLYYGKLYIDAKTLALTSATFSLNVENKELTSKMYVRKKPRKVDVYPIEATYKVNYRTQNGKWHYAYSNILLSFKVNWKGKLFNNVYTLNSEMAVTDWKLNTSEIVRNKSNMLRQTTILIDETSGFADPEFWGEYNIIEPEKSIESAIRKIQRQLKRT